MTKTRILSIFGHPDDAEQFAGGTMKLLSDAGHQVTIAALTDGACGSSTLSAEQIVKERAKEGVNAAKLIGADYVNLGIRDGSLDYDLETVKKVVALIREQNPEIILAPPVDDYMTDHFHTGRLVLWAVPESWHKNFEASTKAPAISRQVYVYHTDPQGLTLSDGQITRVNTIVDITSVIEEKLNAFAAHKSQMGFLPGDKNNAVWKTRRWAIIRGEQVRVEYGEGFYQQLHAEYPKRNILKELLGEKVFTL